MLRIRRIRNPEWLYAGRGCEKHGLRKRASAEPFHYAGSMEFHRPGTGLQVASHFLVCCADEQSLKYLQLAR
jgi:hypothetical protein